ncbi:MAG: DNA translocase FtsK 4TM domain-containing protein [Fidelibacterota bacterium]
MALRDRRTEIIGILLILISLFVFLSLASYNPAEEPTVSPHVAISNRMGIVGVYVSHALVKMTIGYVSYIFPLLGLVWGWWIFSPRSARDLIRVTFYALSLSLVVSVALGFQAIVAGSLGPPSYHYSGLVGGVLARLFHDFLGRTGTLILLLGSTLFLVSGYFGWSLYKPVGTVSSLLKNTAKKRRETAASRRSRKEKREHTEELLEKLREVEKRKELEQELKQEQEQEQGQERWQVEEGEESELSYSIDQEITEEEVDVESYRPEAPPRAYELPSADLLTRPDDMTPSASREELVEKANFLVQSLRTFGVEGKVVNISPGPIITLFEVEPAEGVRVSKFVQLADDLARVMRASRVRIIAPVPGKSSVGIEIPNQNPSTVYIRSVINSERFLESDSVLTVALGKTTSGENYVVRLDKMPHLLIAGTTGSGKSVCINTIITSILYRATPEQVRFILIDPKRLELAAYGRLRKYHLMTSDDVDELVVSTPENAVLALRAAEQEMNRRYDVLADAVVRNIQEYQRKASSDAGLEPMPFIVIIVDELADLMLKAPKEVEAPIGRLAQMARAVGIHLVVATQRPSVDVITGVIKANFPSRIAFQVATKVDSRTIIDANGAEKLIGRGDMLFLPPARSDPIRLHNSYVSLEEIERVIDHICDQPSSEEMKLKGSTVHLFGEGGPGEEGLGDDELFKEAVQLVVTHQQGSISLLQRRLRIGYSRAARLIDEMEQLGIVGPFTGSKARDVLVDESYLRSAGYDQE